MMIFATDMNSALASIQKSYGEMLGNLDAARMQLHPAGDPEQWSAQQLVEHLVLTFRSTDEVLEDRLRKGRPTQAPITREHEVRWNRYIGAGKFPPGNRAPEPVTPGQMGLPALSGVELASLLRKELEAMDGLLDQCCEKFGPQPMASHFAFGPLGADQWREFHVVHAQHHLGQLARILAGEDFSEKTASTT
jgi:Protein of unknown function (DUF1569)